MKDNAFQGLQSEPLTYHRRGHWFEPSTAHHISGSHNEDELPIRELLETLLGPEGRRRLQLRRMSNEGLFRQYDNELILRLHNVKNLSDTRKMLARFKEYLGVCPTNSS